MQKLIFSFICFFIIVSVNAETVFKKVNPDGSISFTDKNTKGSKAVNVQETVTYTPPKLPPLDPIKKKPKPIKYEITIIEPKKDKLFINKPDVNVSISVVPALNKKLKHQFSYQIGERTILSSETSVVFKDLYRGTHELIMSIVDKDREIISPSISNTFHVKRFFKRKAPKIEEKPEEELIPPEVL